MIAAEPNRERFKEDPSEQIIALGRIDRHLSAERRQLPKSCDFGYRLLVADLATDRISPDSFDLQAHEQLARLGNWGQTAHGHRLGSVAVGIDRLLLDPRLAGSPGS